MYSPEARLRDAPVCLVGLNPGGGRDEPNPDEAFGRNWCCEQNAYYHDDWGRKPGKAPLQLQVQMMMELLKVPESGLLAAQFVPFRSPDIASLDRRGDAFDFARKLWTWVLQPEICRARLFLCLGNEAAAEISRLLGASPRRGAHLLPTNWGRTTIGCHETATDGIDRRVVVRLPHLSRYRIFGRSGGASARAEASLRRACEGCLP